MRSRSELTTILYIFSPLLMFTVIYMAGSALMEAGWSLLSRYYGAEETGAALVYTRTAVWNYISQVFPAAAGCIAVRSSAIAELTAYPRRKPVHVRFFPVLLITCAALSISINILFSLIMPAAGNSVPDAGSLPGMTGFILQAAVYGFCMPLIEEILFRGILFARLERAYGLFFAAAASSVAFGIWHGALPQGIYALLLGAVFALAYAVTGRLAVPFALHGACNLTILLLQWTGAWNAVCTPVWCAVVSVIAAGGFFTASQIYANS